jgi:integrase
MFLKKLLSFGDKMTKILTRNTKLQDSKLETMALRIAKESPQLKDLNQEQLEQIAKIVITQRLTDKMNEMSNIADIDYRMEKEIFLKVSSKTNSMETKGLYREALTKLEKYCKKNDLNILSLNYAQLDDYIYSLEGSPNSKRLWIAGISAFYAFLERRYSSVKNPVRGTKARPASKPVKEIEIPEDHELPIILNNVNEIEKLAIYIMAYRGLRVGALHGMKVWGEGYQTVSKGKAIHGRFSDEIMLMIRTSDLDNKTPFAGYTTNALKIRVLRAMQKLQKQGFIKSAYSAHDFRHYFAVSEYKVDKNIYKLSKLLDHSNIAITETYLRSIKIDV